MKVFIWGLVWTFALVSIVACSDRENQSTRTPTAVPNAGGVDPTATTDATEAIALCYPDTPASDELDEPVADFDLAIEQVRIYNGDLPPNVVISKNRDGFYRWFTRREVAEESSQPLDKLYELRNFGFLGQTPGDGPKFKMQNPAPGVDEAPIPNYIELEIYYFTSGACARDWAQSEYVGWEVLVPSADAPTNVVGEYFWRRPGDRSYGYRGFSNTTISSGFATITNVALILENVAPGAVVIKVTDDFGPWEATAQWDMDVFWGPPELLEAVKGFDTETVPTQLLAEALARHYQDTLPIRPE